MDQYNNQLWAANVGRLRSPGKSRCHWNGTRPGASAAFTRVPASVAKSSAGLVLSREPTQALPPLVVAHQAEPEIARLHAVRAAAAARIAEEVRHIGAVTAGSDADPTIDDRRTNLAIGLDDGTHETAVGPFPDIAGQIHEAVFVRSEGADRLRFGDRVVARGCGGVILGQRAPARIAAGGALGLSVGVEPAACCKTPFLVGGQPPRRAGRAREPRRIGGRVTPADADGSAVGLPQRTGNGRASAGVDAALVFRR